MILLFKKLKKAGLVKDSEWNCRKLDDHWNIKTLKM